MSLLLENSPRNYKDDPEQYVNTCKTCKELFIGYRYRKVCATCSKDEVIDQLYEFRGLMSASLFNDWSQDGDFNTYKSKTNPDGSPCKEGWFITVAHLPDGQISFHHPISEWDLFVLEEKNEGTKGYDGHTPRDVIDRLRSYMNARWIEGAPR